jgi:hypothetical protein
LVSDILAAEDRMREAAEVVRESEHSAFYEEHYSDWTVHELPLIVYVPTIRSNRDEALALVREILDEAAFDIRAALAPTAHDAADREPADDWRDAAQALDAAQLSCSCASGRGRRACPTHAAHDAATMPEVP